MKFIKAVSVAAIFIQMASANGTMLRQLQAEQDEAEEPEIPKQLTIENELLQAEEDDDMPMQVSILNEVIPQTGLPPDGRELQAVEGHPVPDDSFFEGDESDDEDDDEHDRELRRNRNAPRVNNWSWQRRQKRCRGCKWHSHWGWIARCQGARGRWRKYYC